MNLLNQNQMNKLEALDITTPWYEYLSYRECCNSLKVKESLTKWINYQKLYKNNFKEHEL